MATQTERTKTLINNLEAWRISNNLSQGKFAKQIGLSPSNYSKLISGEIATITNVTLERIYDITHLTLFQLSERNDDAVLKLSNDLSKLPKSSLRFIQGVVDFELSYLDQRDHNPYLIDVFVPTTNVEDGMIYDSAEIIKLDIGKYADAIGKETIDCGVKITTNHLHNAYHKDDILLIQFKPPRHGDIGIFLNKETHRVYIRKFLQGSPCRLVPLAQTGKTIYVDPDNENDMNQWTKFGIVIAKFRENSGIKKSAHA